MFTLELAKKEEVKKYYEIILEGMAFQRQQGFTQWTKEYPNKDTISDDVKNEKGYVIKQNGDIAGYMCIDFSKEPAYDNIKGEWRSDMPYAVVHRMAFDKKYRGIGLSETAFKMIDKLCLEKGIKNIRVDTHFPNLRMQHILKKNGFVNCGVIMFQGGEKLAFDKLL